MEQAIHVVLNCLRACKHPWNHTKIRGGKQMKGLSWAIHWCCGISAPVPSGRNSCPPNKKAEKHQLCCHHTWQPKHEQRQEEYARPWCMASVFLEIFWSISLWFLAPQCCPVHWCSMPWWREHVRDPHMGTQSCCPPEAPCSLPPAQHSGHRAAPLCSAAEDLNDGHLKCLFLVFDAPFQDALWKLLINGQILALKLVSLEWGRWHYQGEMLYWHRAGLVPSVKPFWCKTKGRAGAHLPHLEQHCDDPHGIGKSCRDFVKASAHLMLRARQQPRLVQHRGSLSVALFLCCLTWKLSCWQPSEEQVWSSFSRITAAPQPSG